MAKTTGLHSLSVEPLEDRLLLAGLGTSPAAVSPPQAPAVTATTATAYAAATPGSGTDSDSSDYATPGDAGATSYSAAVPGTSVATGYPASAGTATGSAATAGHTAAQQPATGLADYSSFTNVKPANSAVPDSQEAARAAQAYDLQLYCMALANATAATQIPVEAQHVAGLAAAVRGEQGANQARLAEQQVQAISGKGEAPPTAPMFSGRHADLKGPEADLLVLDVATAEPGEEAVTEPASQLASEPAAGRLLQPAELLAGRLPLDLPALRERVQEFFAQLTDLAEESAAAPIGIRLAPWFVAVAVATSACEVARRQLRKQHWRGPIPGLDPASRTWTWFPEPHGEAA
jgi:hypothetical protein